MVSKHAFTIVKLLEQYMKDDEQTIIFDGLCNLCEYSVQFIIRNDRRGAFKFVAGQSEKGKDLQLRYGVDTIRDGTVILLKNKRVYVMSDAALEIAKGLDAPWKYMSIFRFLPKSMRDYVYSIISRNRYRWFGRKTACLLPGKDSKDRFLKS